MVTLTSMIAKGATGYVHGGTLELEDGCTRITLPIIMKIAFSADEIQQLQHEDLIYDKLRKACIPHVSTIYGLFQEDCSDGDSGPTGLLMSYCGKSLQESPKVTEEQRRVAFFIDLFPPFLTLF